jgi:hypothetical protein
VTAHVWIAVAVNAVPAGVLSALCATVGLRNLREWRRVRRLEPLDRAEVLAAERPETRPPRQWPAPSSLDDPELVAAYRDFAYRRRDGWVLFGEMAMLTSGAALGTALPRALTHTGAGLAAVGVVGVAMAGHFVRSQGAGHWVSVAALYERRLLALRPANDAATFEEPPPASGRWRRVFRAAWREWRLSR